MSSPPTAIVKLPPLQDDRLYTADETSQYTKLSPNWLSRNAGADKIQHTRHGRFVRWSAQNIRDITSGKPHTPTHGSTRPRRAKAARLASAA